MEKRRAEEGHPDGHALKAKCKHEQANGCNDPPQPPTPSTLPPTPSGSAASASPSATSGSAASSPGTPAEAAALALAQLILAERRAMWAAYNRTFSSASHRQSLRIPEEIALRIAGDQSGVHKANWFNIWLQHGSSWGKVNVWQRHVEAWLTATQITDLYKSPEISAALVAEKSTKPDLWRLHPAIPTIKAAIQYKVMVQSHLKKELQGVIEKGTSMVAECSAEATQVMLPKILAESGAKQPEHLQACCSEGVGSGGGQITDAHEAARLERERQADERKAKKEEERKKKEDRQRTAELSKAKKEFKASQQGQAKS
jgi:hypothetical protein